MLKRIQVISKSVHTKSITPLRLDDGAGLPFDNESEVLVETQQLKEGFFFLEISFPFWVHSSL